MISSDIYLHLLWHLLATVAVAGVAYLIRWANARRSARDRFIGWVVFTTSVGGFFAGGLFIGVKLYGPPIFDWFEKAAFGFLGGLISGNLLGWLGWRYYRREIEGDGEETP